MIDRPKIGDTCNGCGLCCRLQVCGAGSFTLKLVKKYGDRAPGPCPVLMENPDGTSACGLVLRPKDYAPAQKGGADKLRAAVKLLIGAGSGCDEYDPDDPHADKKLNQLQHDFIEKHEISTIKSAARIWYGW